jgi:hypothetical protein
VEDNMPKDVIEREISGAGKLSADEFQAMWQESCGVVGKMGPVMVAMFEDACENLVQMAQQ